MKRIAWVVLAAAVWVPLAGAETGTAYPQAMLSPASPSMTDSVALWLILGEYSSSCVPTYASSFKITQVSNYVCVRYPCAQDFVITLSYKQNPPLPLGRPCLMVITRYGPRFGFGRLAVGSYKVYDSVAKDTVTSFYVSENPIITGHDTVQVLPANPTIKDPLTLNLFLADACCCSRFYKQSVSVTGTSIYLSYEIDNSSCALCDCVAAGKTIAFKSNPLKAGTYAIYKAESPYCPPNQPCPMLAIMPVKVGSVKISAPVAITGPSLMRRGAIELAGRGVAGTYDIRGRLAVISTSRTVQLTVVRDSKGMTCLQTGMRR